MSENRRPQRVVFLTHTVQVVVNVPDTRFISENQRLPGPTAGYTGYTGT